MILKKNLLIDDWWKLATVLTKSLKFTQDEKLQRSFINANWMDAFKKLMIKVLKSRDFVQDETQVVCKSKINCQWMIQDKIWFLSSSLPVVIFGKLEVKAGSIFFLNQIIFKNLPTSLKFAGLSSWPKAI